MEQEITPFGEAVAAVRAGACAEQRARWLYDELSEAERLSLLDGDTPFWEGMRAMKQEGYNVRPYVMGAVARIGLPGIRFVDGPRGCVAGAGTAFPPPMARGASWDISLEEEVGEVIGREIRTQGGNFFGGVCINLPRHPAWGRAQETYGDEPFHLGEMGAALTRGAQKYVMACVKHFALNSMENARFKVDVEIAEPDLHDIYLPHFKRVIDEGVSAVMSAYNSVNGAWAGENSYLLTHVLRELWNWDGVTISDFVFGLRDAGLSLNAGLDLEAPFIQQRAERLAGEIKSGKTSWDFVERAGVRLIAAQLRSYARRAAEADAHIEMACVQSRRLAHKVASRAMVLLKNERVAGAPVLPLSPAVKSIALIGRLACAPNMGDAGSSNVRAPSHATPYDGLRAAFPDARIVLVSSDDAQAAAKAAREAEVAIIVAGYDKHDEGEFFGDSLAGDPVLAKLFPALPDGARVAPRMSGGVGGDTSGGDRANLRLRGVDEEIIASVCAANPRTIVAVVAAGAVIRAGAMSPRPFS